MRPNLGTAVVQTLGVRLGMNGGSVRIMGVSTERLFYKYRPTY